MEPDYRGIALTKLLREHARHLLAIAQAHDDAKPIPGEWDLIDAAQGFVYKLMAWESGAYDHTLGGKPYGGS